MDNINYKPAYTPSSLAKDKHLNVPIYQRLFVWGEEQIKLLLEDLYNTFFDKDKSIVRMPAVPYYIGIITVVEKNGKWDIVDGQQRLTFLSLFGAYCCSQCKEKESVWKNFIFDEQNNLRIDYMGRTEDREDLKKIACKEFSSVNNPNFRLFVECMEKIFSDSCINDFAEYVYNNASFLITELPANYAPADLNLFFEKMNATGKQLTAIEQIKGKYFPAHAAEFDACLNFDKKWKESQNSSGDQNFVSLKSILELDDKRNVDPESNNNSHDGTSRSILAPEVFLLHCLEILKRKDVPHDERKILETFKAHVASEGENKIKPDDFLNTMKEYRTWLDNNIIYLNAAPNDSWEYTFRSEDNEQKEYEDQAKKESDVDVNIRLKLKQFQAMLYVSSSNYQIWVLDAYLSSKPFSLDLLKKQDNERHTINQEAMTYQSIDRYWFWKLDYLLWEKFMDHEDQFKNYYLSDEEKSAIRNYKFRRNRSIEHLHPQTYGDIDKWQDQDAKHQFGNLAMISSSFNSLQQNDSIGVKFARLRDTQIPQKNLESIKLLLMFKVAGGQESGWTVEVMQDHGKEMLKMLGFADCNQ